MRRREFLQRTSAGVAALAFDRRPNGRRRVYDWPRTFALVRKLQPHAVVFSEAGPDVRWCGNESGTAGGPTWSTVNPARVAVPGATGKDVGPALQHGDVDGAVWRPAAPEPVRLKIYPAK